jgi:hypothetical protein
MQVIFLYPYPVPARYFFFSENSCIFSGISSQQAAMDALIKRQAEMKHFLIATKFNDPFLKIKATLFFIIFYLIAFTSIAQTGIGTTTPDPSAKLDVNSSNKGFLPPRVTLISTTDITTIANPATALLVYNTGNNVNISAGYYYWNGTNWARISSNGIILASSAITVSATTTAPTSGIRTIDRTFAVDNGATKTITLQLGYEGSAAGSGDYLFSLPTGITFNTNAGYNPIYTGALWTPTVGSMAAYFIPLQGGIVVPGAWSHLAFVIPYSSTQYRIALAHGGSLALWSSSFFQFVSSTSFNGSFDIR